MRTTCASTSSPISRPSKIADNGFRIELGCLATCMHTPANGVAHQSGGTYTHSLSLSQYSTPLPSLSATLDTVCLFVSLCVCLCTQTRRSMTNLANLRSASHIGLKRVGKRVRIVGRRGRRVWLPLWCVSVDDHFRQPSRSNGSRSSGSG